nr:hypothetical protein [Tanacetum cinerariifolium]
MKCYNCQGEGHMARQYTQNSAFQTKDLDAYDSDCNVISSAKAVLKVNLSSCDFDVLSEQESQDTGTHDTNSSAPNDILVLSLVEKMTDHVANLDMENQTNKTDFRLKHSNYNLDTSVKSRTLVRIKASRKLPKSSVDKNNLEIQNEQLRIDNNQLLNQIMSQKILHIAVNSIDILDMPKLCVDEYNKCLELETGLFKKKI